MGGLRVYMELQRTVGSPHTSPPVTLSGGGGRQRGDGELCCNHSAVTQSWLKICKMSLKLIRLGIFFLLAPTSPNADFL